MQENERILRPGDTNVRNQLEINRLCDMIRQTSFEIHKYFRSGHLEKIYENALTHRLTKLGIEAIQQHPLNVFDEDGALLGHLCADLFVAGTLVVEVKACRNLVDEHIGAVARLPSRFSNRARTSDQFWWSETPNQEIHSQ
jgi:GxxExxY protein